MNVERILAIVLSTGGEENPSVTGGCEATTDRKILPPPPWGMLLRKLTVPQRKGQRDNLPPTSEPALTQRSQMHRAAAKPTSPPLVPACGFLIRQRSDSDTRNLRLTIDEDGWRAALSCCLTRSRKITRVGTTRRVESPTSLPHHILQPPSRSGRRRRGSDEASALRCVSALTAPHHAVLLSLPPPPTCRPPMRGENLTLGT
jgi:hypothetical protein